jgi:hypothetical protein
MIFSGDASKETHCAVGNRTDNAIRKSSLNTVPFTYE